MSALRAYDKCRRVLADGLGVQPSPPIRGLFLELLRQEGTGTGVDGAVAAVLAAAQRDGRGCGLVGAVRRHGAAAAAPGDRAGDPGPCPHRPGRLRVDRARCSRRAGVVSSALALTAALTAAAALVVALTGSPAPTVPVLLVGVVVLLVVQLGWGTTAAGRASFAGPVTVRPAESGLVEHRRLARDLRDQGVLQPGRSGVHAGRGGAVAERVVGGRAGGRGGADTEPAR